MLAPHVTRPSWPLELICVRRRRALRRPDSDPVPNPTPAPTEVWSISGRVTAYGSNVGVSGAHVTAEAARRRPTRTPTDATASRTNSLPATPDIKVTVAATGFMVRISTFGTALARGPDSTPT